MFENFDYVGLGMYGGESDSSSDESSSDRQQNSVNNDSSDTQLKVSRRLLFLTVFTITITPGNDTEAEGGVFENGTGNRTAS